MFALHCIDYNPVARNNRMALVELRRDIHDLSVHNLKSGSENQHVLQGEPISCISAWVVVRCSSCSGQPLKHDDDHDGVDDACFIMCRAHLIKRSPRAPVCISRAVCCPCAHNMSLTHATELTLIVLNDCCIILHSRCTSHSIIL